MTGHRVVVDEARCYEAFRGLREVMAGVGLGRTTSADAQRYVNCIRDHVELHRCFFRVLPDWRFPEDAINEGRWGL